MKDINIIVLKNCILDKVEVKGNDQVLFETKDGRKFLMYHGQECCESVAIESVTGKINSIIGVSILDVKEIIDSENWPDDVKEEESSPETFTWTTFQFTTKKGNLTIRWFGISNGYYSESVSFGEIFEDDNAI